MSLLCVGWSLPSYGVAAAQTSLFFLAKFDRCETPIPYVASGQSVRPSRRRSAVTCCLASDRRQDLNGETVAVVGLGASGRAAVKLALARGADVVALDSNPSCLPLEEDSAFEGYDLKRVYTELGPHKHETLLKASQLVLSPGGANFLRTGIRSCCFAR